MADAGSHDGSHDAAPADAREWPVPWQPVWGEHGGLASRVSTWAVRAAMAGAKSLPSGALTLLLERLAALAARVDRRRARAAHEFLQQAFGPLAPDELARRTRRAYLQLLRVTVDTERFLARVPFERMPAQVELVTTPEARAVLDARRGALMVTAHLGNWEVGLPTLAAYGFHPVYGVAKPAKNRFLSQLMQASRERHGVRILSRKGAMGAAPSVLKAGGIIGLVIDQRTSGRALLAPFFGRLARCERAPGVLLKRQRVPIVFGVCWPAERDLTYRLELGNVLQPEEWAVRSVEEIAVRINQGLEGLIRTRPEQYVWIHDRYKDTPRTLEPGAEARIRRNDARPAPSE